jgi:hypothetical protein
MRICFLSVLLSRLSYYGRRRYSSSVCVGVKSEEEHKTEKVCEDKRNGAASAAIEV